MSGSPPGLRALLLLAALAAAPARAVDVAERAPALAARTLNPQASGVASFALADVVGPAAKDAGARLVLVSFFAAWCGPCREELPFLVALDRRYRGQGLRVVSVDVDTDTKDVARARALVANAGVRHPVLQDRRNVLARRYLGDSAPLPTTFLVRRDGVVARVERGFGDEAAAALRAEVAQLLRTPAGADAPPSAGGAPPRPGSHP